MPHAIIRGRHPLLALLAAAAIACAPCAASAAVHLYVPITPGPQSTGVVATYPLVGGMLGTPADFMYQNVGTYAFALGPDGLLYDSDGSARVSVYASRANTLLYAFHTPKVCLGSGQYNVTGLGVDAANYLYVGYLVTGCGGSYALRYGTRGVFVYAPGQQGGTPLLRFVTVAPPTDFAFDRAGNAYISEIYYPAPIEVFSSPHSQPARIRSLADFGGRCIGPVALDQSGELYAVVNCGAAGASFVAVYPQMARGKPMPTREINVAGGLGCCSIAVLQSSLYITNGVNTVYQLNKAGSGTVQPLSSIQTANQYYGYFDLRIGP
jgi:hypothetical protein